MRVAEARKRLEKVGWKCSYCDRLIDGWAYRACRWLVYGNGKRLLRGDFTMWGYRTRSAALTDLVERVEKMEAR